MVLITDEDIVEDLQSYRRALKGDCVRSIDLNDTVRARLSFESFVTICTQLGKHVTELHVKSRLRHTSSSHIRRYVGRRCVNTRRGRAKIVSTYARLREAERDHLDIRQPYHKLAALRGRSRVLLYVRSSHGASLQFGA